MSKRINHLDLFSGIGGFHLGFERAGYKINSFFSEIDKHSIAVYKHKFPKSTYVGSVTDVRGGDLPNIDLITFGSPCQDFSLAGKRAGMGGDRSVLILEAIRLIRECRPRVFVWENVKGTFSSNAGEDFAAIIQEFANIGGYRLEWQLLNTSWFLPQNRERIYLVGYSTAPKRGWRGVFPITESNNLSNEMARERQTSACITTSYHKGANYDNQLIKVKQTGTKQHGIEIVGHRGTGGQQGFIYGESGIAPTLNACGYKDPTKVKVKQIGTKFDSNGGTQPYQQDRVYDADGIVPALNQGKSDLILRIKSATAKGYEEATIGDTFNIAQPNSDTRRGRVGSQKAQTLDTSCNQAVVEPMIYDGYNNKVKEDNIVGTITQHCSRSGMTNGFKVIQPNYTDKSLNETIERNVLTEGEPKALDLYNRAARDESPTLTEPHHNSLRLFDGYRIRRLTPIECERLQGFPDDHTAYGDYDGDVKPVSNTQRYKQCGNAVTVDVVQAVAERLKQVL